jgi:hypothetical protein
MVPYYRVRDMARFLRQMKQNGQRITHVNYIAVTVERHASLFLPGIYMVWARDGYVLCHSARCVAQAVYYLAPLIFLNNSPES